eukprot:215653-Chlamydomonas_euryale.AAC.3
MGRAKTLSQLAGEKTQWAGGAAAGAGNVTFRKARMSCVQRTQRMHSAYVKIGCARSWIRMCTVHT